MNEHQAALLVTLNQLKSALQDVKAKCVGVTNLTANFPAGSLPVISFDVEECNSAMDPLISELQKDVDIVTEFVNLA